MGLGWGSGDADGISGGMRGLRALISGVEVSSVQGRAGRAGSTVGWWDGYRYDVIMYALSIRNRKLLVACAYCSCIRSVRCR